MKYKFNILYKCEILWTNMTTLNTSFNKYDQELFSGKNKKHEKRDSYFFIAHVIYNNRILLSNKMFIEKEKIWWKMDITLDLFVFFMYF